MTRSRPHPTAALTLACAALAALIALPRAPRAAAQDRPPAADPPRSAESSPTSAPSAGRPPDEYLAPARAQVERFFGRPFPRPFDVRFLPDRAAFSDFARQRWQMETTDCWMVAMGVSSLMVALSPDAWSTDACEHEPTPQHIHEIFTHELVHVFHGQHNPSHEFDGMDDVGWFVEGLAIFAADQLTPERMSRLAEAVAAGRAPARLADAWSGEHRYGISGSLVRYIDRRWGRATLIELLPATNNDQILARLDISEADLLSAWRNSLTDPRPSAPAP